jgi:hypothetical protein
MGYQFPNAAKIIAVIIDGHEVAVGEQTAGVTAALRLEATFDQHLPVARVRRTGGTEDGPLRTDRVAVDVYAVGTTAAQTIADELCAFLVGRDHDAGDLGSIDDVSVETVPTEVPYASERISQVTATYRVDSRGF